MMTKLQTKYADKPVKFVLVPCNQFGAQEPGSNADIKKFAEKSIDLSKGNVIMLAKSNLNDVKCSCSGSECCMPDSTECCPANDGVYDYLLKHVSPANIGWNFDKIITGPDGKPYSGESPFVGGDVEPALSTVIDEQLATLQSAATEMSALPFSRGLAVLAASSAASFLLTWLVIKRWQGREQDEASTYVHLVA